MKGNAIVRIVIYGLLIGILILILIGTLGYDLYFSNIRLNWNDSPVPAEAPLPINQQEIYTQIQNIEIDWVEGTISIHPSDSLDHISISEVSIDENTPRMICSRNGQTLKIEFSEENERFHLFGNNKSVSKDLVIRVPKNWNCNNLEIDAAATDVNIQDLTIRELDFDGASGNLILDHCNITDLDIDTASGDIEFVGTLDNLDFDAASAKFYGEFYNSPHSLKMDSMSGDLELVLPEYTGFELNMETVSGSFDTDFTFGKHNDLYICGDGNCKIKVSAMSSDVSILKGITAGKNCDH